VRDFEPRATLQQRLDDEVVYYRQEGDLDPYGINVSRLDSLGGGLANPSRSCSLHREDRRRHPET
jgi:hypothetical protein